MLPKLPLMHFARRYSSLARTVLLSVVLIAAFVVLCGAARANTYSVAAQFTQPYGNGPSGGVIQTSNGTLYGTTVNGGSNGYGVVYSVNAQGVESVLHNFTGPDGQFPHSGLVLASDGNLYGTTGSGGTGFPNGADQGTIFKITPTGTFTSLYSFTGGTDGGSPQTSMIQGIDGELYGVSNASAYRITLTGYFHVVFNFAAGSGGNYPDGEYPEGPLVQEPNGKLYGMTNFHGSAGQGNIFEVNPDGTGFEAVYNFSGTDYGNPITGLTLGQNGILYGSAQGGVPSGYGIIFSFNTANNKLTVLYNVQISDDLENITSPLLLDSSGNIYGVSDDGGGPTGPGDGCIFKFNGTSLTTLYTFDYDNGEYPTGSLIFGINGDILGTTQEGGYYAGEVYECNTAGTDLQPVYKFVLPNGNKESSPVLVTVDGNTYGISPTGGLLGYGQIWELTTAGTLVDIHDFGGIDGAYPIGQMACKSDGTICGVTNAGGPNFAPAAGKFGDGTIFEFQTGGTSFHSVHEFNTINPPYDNSLGNPQGGVVLGPDNNFYGTCTGHSLQNGYATLLNSGVWTYNPVTSTYTTLTYFVYPNLLFSLASMTWLPSDNAFYGTDADDGADGHGDLFRVDMSGNFSVVYSFTGGADGSSPSCELTLDPDGSLYGTAKGGGANSDGTFYKYSPAAGFTLLSSLTSTVGQAPFGGLTESNSTAGLIGPCQKGGSYGKGSIISAAITGALENQYSFTVANSIEPKSQLVLNPAGDFVGTGQNTGVGFDNVYYFELLSITSSSPTTTKAGVPVSMTISGHGFDPAAVVTWNGFSVPTTSISNHTISLTVPASVNTLLGTYPGSATIVVSDPDGTTASATIAITEPTPVLTSLSPASAKEGAATFTMTLSGSNFVSGANVYWNSLHLAPTFVSSSQMTATVLASLLTAEGTATVFVKNPTTGGSSNTKSFSITEPTPVLTSISPMSVKAGSAAFTLTLNGSYFVSGANVYWNNLHLAPTFVSASKMTAQVPASLVTTAGTATVFVKNPTTGGSSKTQTFTITP